MGLQKSLQQEWQFIQPVVNDSRESFLLSLVFDDDDHRQKLATLPVKFAGLAIPDPMTSSNPNYKASTLMCSHLVATLHGICKFRTLDHKEIIREVNAELKTCNAMRHDTALIALAAKLSSNDLQ
jgi:hypothetical protein